MREIGSEFWQRYDAVYPETTDSEVYLLSGRTALKYIIDDIRKQKPVRKVLLPSYCCDSMIFPFVQSGIEVVFYQVELDGLKYPYGNDADIILLIDYFGFGLEKNREIVVHEKQVGKIIIYDSTHKIDGNPAVEAFADYSFCSYRKWFCCNYARAVKYNGEFHSGSPRLRHERYMSLREAAAREKDAYMNGLPTEKESFLEKFRTAEQILDEDYVGYGGIPVAFDMDKIVARRRENATYLVNRIKEIPQIKLWFEKVCPCDTPMFVPVLVDPAIRNELRKHLISHQIYCPCHWPISACHGTCNELYHMELSLICDQRYGLDDMERLVSVLKEFFE